MKDAEFISELFVLVVDGVQDQQKSLDKFYSDYDVVFPQKSRSMSRFRQVVAAMESIKRRFETRALEINPTSMRSLLPSLN